jgi:hypothetical protein
VKKFFWAALRRYSFCTGLLPLNEDSKSARGGVIAWVISEVYRAFLSTIVRPGDTFMQDEASVHTAHIIRQLLTELGVTVIE